VSEAFAAIAELALSLGASRICDLPGCWEHQIDAQWWVSVNGHRDPCRDSRGHDVPGFTAFLEYAGWPAGLIDPRGGVIAAGGAANEGTFIEAVRKATGCPRRTSTTLRSPSRALSAPSATAFLSPWAAPSRAR